MNCETCGGACCKCVMMRVGRFPDEHRPWADIRGLVRPIGGGVYEWWIKSLCKHLVAGRCAIQADKPKTCRDFVVGGAECRAAIKAMAELEK